MYGYSVLYKDPLLFLGGQLQSKQRCVHNPLLDPAGVEVSRTSKQQYVLKMGWAMSLVFLFLGNANQNYHASANP